MLQAILPSIIGTLLVTSVTGVFLALAWRPWNGPRSNRPGWGAALGLGLGYAAAHGYLVGWPPLPPVTGKQWVFALALAAAIIGSLHTLVSGKRALHYGLCGLLALAVPLATLQSKLRYGWEPGEAVPEIGLLAALAFLWLLSNEDRAERSEGATLPLTLVITTFGASAALGLSSSASLAELAGMLTAGISLYVVASWRWQFVSIAQGGIAVTGAVLTGLLINGHFFAELPATSGLLLLAAPEATRLQKLGPLAELAGWKRTLVHATLTAIPVAAAVGLALAGFLAESKAAADDPYAGY